MMLIPYGYAGASIPLEQLVERQTFTGLHPEFRRRLRLMLEAGNGRLGLGQGWRSSAVQEATFLQRHQIVISGGCCSYKGRRYQLRPGYAHAAPPGLSFHESQEIDGGTWAMAADMIGDLAWMHSVCLDFGLKHFAAVNSEPWHVQFLELPNSVAQWKAIGSPGPNAPAPGKPQTPVGPVDPQPSEEDEMLKVIRHGRYGAAYKTNGLIKVWLDNGHVSAAALKQCGQTEPEEVDENTCAAYGPIIGPVPTGHDAYGRVRG